MAAFPTIHELEVVILVNTDNATSATSLSSGRVVDPTLGACVRGCYTLEIRHNIEPLNIARDHCTSKSIPRVRITRHPLPLSPSL